MEIKQYKLVEQIIQEFTYLVPKLSLKIWVDNYVYNPHQHVKI